MLQAELSESPEVTQTPEVIVADLTARIERGLHELGIPAREDRRWGSCNFIPDAVNYCAIQDGREKGYEVHTAMYQARDLHLRAAGQKTLRDIWQQEWDSTGVAHNTDAQAVIGAYYADPEVKRVSDMTFLHGFNVVTIDDVPFLVDLSFAQFIGPEGTLANGANGNSSGISNEHPLAQQLLREGFMPLTDENLRAYMRFLCTEEPTYLEHVTLDLISQVPALPFAMDNNELVDEHLDEVPPAYRAHDPLNQ